MLGYTFIACIVTFLFVSILSSCTNESLYKIFKLRALKKEQLLLYDGAPYFHVGNIWLIFHPDRCPVTLGGQK